LRTEAAPEDGAEVEVTDVCSPSSKLGKWMRKVDLVAVGKKLEVKEMDGIQKCNAECRTVQKACKQIIRKHDLEDLAESGKWQSMCKAPCAKAPPAVPADRVDEPFTAMEKSDADLEDVMSSMNAAGLGGGMQVFSRDDIAKMKDTDFKDL
jgi:hypothetical protein